MTTDNLAWGCALRILEALSSVLTVVTTSYPRRRRSSRIWAEKMSEKERGNFRLGYYARTGNEARSTCSGSQWVQYINGSKIDSRSVTKDRVVLDDEPVSSILDILQCVWIYCRLNVPLSRVHEHRFHIDRRRGSTAALYTNRPRHCLMVGHDASDIPPKCFYLHPSSLAMSSRHEQCPPLWLLII